MPNLSSSALSAQTFLNGIGVDTHIPYTDGGYANIANVISDLKYLGVSNIRDGITDGAKGSAPLSSYIALAKAGMHFTIVIEAKTTGELSAQLNLIDQLQSAVPGAVVAVEGPNEINNWPITFDGVGGLQGALNLQSALYSAVHSDPTLAGVAVDYFTGYAAGQVPVGPDPVAAGLADFNNQHPYPKWGQAPAAWVDRDITLPNTTSPTTPAVYTETGYSANEVGLNVQAKYTLDLLFDTASEGISRTYLYQLMDAYSPTSPQGNDGFGLFDWTKAAKPVATAIHNLTTILQDTAQTAGPMPTALDFQISGLPSSGRSLVLAKANGAYDIVLWAEPQLHDPNTHQEIAAPSYTATVALSQAVAGYSVYDPLVGAAAIASGANASVVQVAVSDHPVIIEVRGAAASGAPGPSTAPQVLGAAGADTLIGPDGQSNYIRGLEGNDSITGGTWFNNVNGNPGNDTIIGRSQLGDWLLGGQGDDLIEVRAGDARNIINGNLGADTLVAGGGSDTVRGGQGDDLLTGGAGGDWLSGDRGIDTLTGGEGADIFHSGPGLGVSHIMDFDYAQGDRIQLDPGSQASFSQIGAGMLVDLGGGTQMVLHGASLAALQNNPNWLI